MNIYDEWVVVFFFFSSYVYNIEIKKKIINENEKYYKSLKKHKTKL